MPPDWRLFHVRRSSGRRLFFEVPYKKSSDSSVGSAKAISSRDGIQRKNGKLIRIRCIDAYKNDIASIDSHTVFISGR